MCELHNHDAAAGTANSAEEVAECPVMPGREVNKAEAEADGLFRDYNGQRYYLCCDSCGPMFDGDPAKYASV